MPVIMMQEKNKGDQLLSDKLQEDYFGVGNVQTYIGSMSLENPIEDIYAKIQLQEGSNTTLQFIGDHYYEDGSNYREVVGKVKAGVAVYFDKPINQYEPREEVQFGSNKYVVLDPLDADTYSMTIGKERVYSTMSIGDEISYKGELSARLADVADDGKAIIEIMKEESVVGQVQIENDQTHTYVNPSTGEELKLHLYKSAPGIDMGAKWAELAIVDDIYKLTNNEMLDQEANSIDRHTKVYFGHDFDINHINSRYQGVEQADMIFLYPEDAFHGVRMTAGDEIDMPTILDASLVYEGLEHDRDKGDGLPINIDSENNVELNLGDGETFQGDLIRFGTGSMDDWRIQMFVDDKDSEYEHKILEDMFIDPKTKTIYARHESDDRYRAYTDEDIVIKTLGNYPNNPENKLELQLLDYEKSKYPSMRDVAMVINISETSRPELEAPHPPELSFAMGEIVIPVMEKSDGYRFKNSDSSTSYAYYKGIGAGDYNAYVAPMITDRGSRFENVDIKNVNLSIWNTIRTGNWQFKDNYKEEDPTTVKEGVDQQQEQSTLLLYPNPASAIVNLDVLLPETGETNVEVFDEAGNRVLHPIQNQRHMKGPQEMRIDVDAAKLPSGTYFVKVSQRGWSEVTQLKVAK